MDNDGDLDIVVADANDTPMRYFHNIGTTLKTPVFIERIGIDNPFNGQLTGYRSTPALGDLDNDGDFDLVLTTNTRRQQAGDPSTGTLEYIENTATNLSPFADFDVGSESKPVFADVDGDGDNDVVVGEQDGVLNYFENISLPSGSPAYIQRLNGDNPFNTVSLSGNSAPALADLDGDNDLDVVIGASDGLLHFFQNNNSAYEEQTGENNPFNGLTVLGGTPALADIDNDGDFDAIVGGINGLLQYFENTGIAAAPQYQPRTGSDNPFNAVNEQSRSTPALFDFDSDGDLDLVLGRGGPIDDNNNGSLVYYENTGNSVVPEYIKRNSIDSRYPFNGPGITCGSTSNPINLIDVGDDSAPALADIDGDGDIDVLVGAGPSLNPTCDARNGRLTYYENQCDDCNLSFEERLTADNPFNDINISSFSRPAFGDTDNDGDFDVVVSTPQGLFYFENTSNAARPVYTPRTGADNPFSELTGTAGKGVALADFDGDAKIDLAIVNDDGGTLGLSYFKNIGTAEAPAYSSQGDPTPFTTVNAANANVFSPMLAVADLESTPGPEIVIGSFAGEWFYLKNTGSLANPQYQLQTDLNNPFVDINVGIGGIPSGSYAAPALADGAL
ncbi:MAG: VCBS repeat-containing protein [Chloroflexota bacterium]